MEGVKYFLQRDDLFVLFVNGFPDDTVGSLSQSLDYFKFP